MAITLTGRITDITNQPPEKITSAVVKYQTFTVGENESLATSAPRELPISPDGSFTIDVTPGKGCLYLTGPGWTESVGFVAADGMTAFIEAVANFDANPIYALIRELIAVMGGATESELQALVDQAKSWYDLIVASPPATSLWLKPALTDKSDINALRRQEHAGIYPVQLPGYVTALGLPGNKIGTLSVKWIAGVNGAQTEQYWEPIDGSRWLRVSKPDETWGPWENVNSPLFGINGLGTTHLDTLLTSNIWHQTVNGWATPDRGYPNATRGVLTVVQMSPSITVQTYRESYYKAEWQREYMSGTWGPWEKVIAGPVSNAAVKVPAGNARRDFLVSDLRDRKGGTIGTGGKAAVCFRFDHHTDQFKRLILPELEKRGLPWAQALNSRTQGAGNNTMTWEEIQAEAIRTGGEVFNHGATHGDAQDTASLTREIVDGRNELRAALPLLPIDGWMQPGTGGSFGGLQPFATEDNWTTEAGQMIMSHHAIVYGYKPGTMENLDGQPSIGQNHLSMDMSSFDVIKAEIDRAVTTKTGMVLMCHPNYVEETIGAGQLTLATLIQVMDYVAQKRAEGVLEVVSASGLQLCDVTHNVRRALVSKTFTGNFLDGQRLLNKLTFAANGAHEVYLDCTAAGDVLVEVWTPDKALNLTKTVQSGKSWIPFTIPVGATDISIRVTGATSGTATIRPI